LIEDSICGERAKKKSLVPGILAIPFLMVSLVVDSDMVFGLVGLGGGGVPLPVPGCRGVEFIGFIGFIGFLS